MSVGVCVASKAGLGLVADGRRLAQTPGQVPQFEISSENARKLFLCDGRFAIATFGGADVGSQSIEEVLAEFRPPENCDCQQCAAAIGAHVSAALDEASPPRRGDPYLAEGMRWTVHFMVAGYDGNVGRTYEIHVRAGNFAIEERSISTMNPGVYAFGQTDAIDRLLTGIDFKALKEARIAIPPQERSKIELLGYAVIVPETLAEAIELAKGLIDVQFLAQRFTWGAIANRNPRIRGCGGVVRALSVTQDGAQWCGANDGVIAGRPDPVLDEELVPVDGVPVHARRSA